MSSPTLGVCVVSYARPERLLSPQIPEPVVTNFADGMSAATGCVNLGLVSTIEKSSLCLNCQLRVSDTVTSVHARHDEPGSECLYEVARVERPPPTVVERSGTD